MESRWTLIKFVEKRRGYDYWLMKCSCGTEKEVLYKNYKSGKSKSCGCYNREIITGRPSSQRKAFGESDFQFLFTIYKRGARERNHEFELTKEEFRKLTSSNCYFCGIEPKQRTGRINYLPTHGEYIYNGVDRKDNFRGYVFDNCLPCCKICNYAKHKLSFEDFEDWLNRIVGFRTGGNKNV
jgi:hypothetical protein